MSYGKRFWLIVALAAASLLAVGVYAQRKDSKEVVPDKEWEYLVVAGGNTNLSTIGNEQYPGLRKQTEFNREAFPLERNLDKLGAKGWELVSVYGPPNEPIYYLKRPKKHE